MEKQKVVVIKTNLVDQDPRLPQEIDALKRGGYAITLLCWDRQCGASSPRPQGEDDYKERRIRFKAPHSNTPKVLLFWPMWWCLEFFWLMATRWDISHAINFDTIMPAMVAAKIKRKPIIYEMYDAYEDSIKLPRILRNICVFIDKLFMRLATTIIIVDEARIQEFGGIPNPNIAVIYNSPPPLFSELNASIKKHNKFTIFHAAALYRSRKLNLDKVITAIENIDNIELIVAGYGDQVEEVKKWADKAPGKVKFIGQISRTEACNRSMMADLLFALHDPVVLNNRYTSTCKLFEAMMCSRPILVNKGTAMGEIVQKENCGLVVDCNNTEEIRNAIIRLRDDAELCRQLGANGSTAYEQKYNWRIMEQRLLTLYQQISNKVSKKPEGDKGCA